MCIYFTTLMTYCHKNKYSKWYEDIIINAITRSSSRKEAKKLFNYVEGHHVLPRFLCIDDNQKNNKDNIVFLTAREHFIVHWLLTKMIISKKSSAYFALSRFRLDQYGLRKLTSKQYEIARRAASLARQSQPTWNKGLKYKTNPCSAIRAKNISDSRKKTKKIFCNFCEKSFDPGNYKKYHGISCKENPDVNEDILLQRKELSKKCYQKAKERDTYKSNIENLHKIELTCPWCSFKSKNKGNILQYHFDKCNKNPSFGNTKRKSPFQHLVTCIFCRKTTNIGNFTLHHKNCETRPELFCIALPTCPQDDLKDRLH